jgi:hypothetical protein
MNTFPLSRLAYWDMLSRVCTETIRATINRAYVECHVNVNGLTGKCLRIDDLRAPCQNSMQGLWSGVLWRVKQLAGTR